MNAWHFVLGAYLVTAIVMVIEVLSVRAAHRAALTATSDAPPSRSANPA